MINDLKFEICSGETIVSAGVHCDASLRERSIFEVSKVATARSWCDDLRDRNAKRFREFIVTFIVRWHCHDGSRAVADQHIVGDPDRDAFAVHGIDGVSASEDARFFFGEVRAVEIALER